MRHRDIIVLKKILEYCNQCEESRAMFQDDFEKFRTISVFQNSSCMCILQIGELCKVISDELRNEASDVPWKEWCGIRDIFAHQYSNIDYQSAWETIQVDLPQLKARIEELLQTEPSMK